MKYHFIILFQFLIVASRSQNPSPYFHHYQTEDGLPSSEVHCTFQDTAGLVWIGTDNGLSSFDGYEFSTYGSEDGIDDHVITNILEDINKNLWIGSISGRVYIKSGNLFVPYKFNPIIERFLSIYGMVELIVVDEKCNAYFELGSYGILKIDEHGHETVITCSSRHQALLFKGKNWSSIKKCENATKYVSKDGSQLFEIVSLDQRMTVKLHSFRMDNSKPYAYSLNDRNCFIISGQQWFILENDNIVWTDENPFLVYHVLIEEDGSYYVGMSHKKGLRKYKNLESLKNGKFDLMLEGHTITDVKKDRDKGIWVSTLNAGLFYTPNLNVTIYDHSVGLPNSTATSCEIINESAIFVGYSTGEIFEIDLFNKEFTEYPTSGGLGTNYIYDLFYDLKREILWADQGRFKHRSWVTTIRHSSGPKRFYSKKYFFDKNRDLLWGIKGNGFYSVDLDSESFSPETNNMSLKQRFFTIYVDYDSRIWLGGEEGLFEWKDTSLLRPKVDHPAFYLRIEDIDAFECGTKIFATKGRGVILWRDSLINEITTSEGLASNVVQDIHVDDNNVAWVSTFSGLSRIELDGSSVPVVKSFSVKTGLPTNEIHEVNSHHGQVWICSKKGLIKWTEPSFDTISYSPTVKSIKVNFEKIKEEDKLRHDENNVTMEFGTIDFRQLRDITYRYRINRDQNWAYTKSRQVNYGNMTPGKYSFEVQSQNAHGIWSESAFRDFVIAAPWYRSLYFFMLLAGSAALIYMQALKFIWKRKLEKEKFKYEIKGLKKAALQARINPHFIFNCLNSIQALINKNRIDSANLYLVTFSRLVRKCLEFSMSSLIPLEDDIAFLEDYLELEKMRFSSGFNYSIVTVQEVDPDKILIEPLLILPFVENAVLHGISIDNQLGAIGIKYFLEEDHLIVTVEDNGPGIGSTIENSESAHKSVGISLAEKRIRSDDLLGRDTIDICDKIDQEGTVLGTLIRIRISIHPEKLQIRQQ